VPRITPASVPSIVNVGELDGFPAGWAGPSSAFARPKSSTFTFPSVVSFTFAGFLFGAPDDDEKLKSLGTCVLSMDDEQMRAIFDKYAVLIASTTAPAGPDDVIGRSMIKAGCQIERFLAPVEPGNLFLLGYKDDVPIVSAPGCFRSAKPNVVDLMLPPMLARYRVSRWEVACLGHGGLFA
jgi:hypothetical protein